MLGIIRSLVPCGLLKLLELDRAGMYVLVDFVLR